MYTEPIPGVHEGFQPTLNVTSLYEHYLPIATEAFNGGMSSVEQESLRQAIADSVAGKTLGDFETIQKSLQFLIDLAKSRPLSRQIAELEERFKLDERHIKVLPITYMSGRLITDRLYPAEPKEYGKLEFRGSGAISYEEQRSNVFAEIDRNGAGRIVPIPVFETEPTWFKPHYQWQVTAELGGPAKRIEDPRLVENLVLPRMLVYRGGRSSEFKTSYEREADSGLWKVNIGFRGGSAAARNLERVARVFAKADSYQVVKR